MDDDARNALLDAAMEAYWAADGGTCGGLIAALAVIEPVVREDCAKVAERRWRDWSGVHPDDAKPGEVCDDVTACEDIAAVIRAGINVG